MRRPRYDQPFHWWGPGWGAPTGRGLENLLREDVLDPGTAAVLWAALARRSSLVVAAGPSGAGKTTLLTALLAFLPAQTRRVYLRGSFESFAFLSDASIVPAETVLLINELSPHLPIYLWGPAVERVLAATQSGYSLLATAHAESVAEFVGALTGSPLRIPAPLVAAIEFVVFLENESETSGRRVREVVRLSKAPGGVSFEALPRQTASDDGGVPQSAAGFGGGWFPDQELAQRRRILDEVRLGTRNGLLNLLS